MFAHLRLEVITGVVPGRTSEEPSLVVTTHSCAPLRSSMPGRTEIGSELHEINARHNDLAVDLQNEGDTTLSSR